VTHRRRTWFVALSALLTLGFAKYAAANPGIAACALIDAIPSERGADAEGLLSNAQARVLRTFGAPRAQPIIVFWDHQALLSKFRLNEYASSHFLGTRSCVFIGPKGRSIDVVAHELVHAEVFDRVGPWARMKQVPVWFDEGLAMQVDFREQYGLPADTDTSYVRNAASPADFFVDNDQQLTRNYGAAKVQVAKWVAAVGSSSVYSQLARLRAGESFANVVATR
jgi:hypothetical protein